MAKSSGTQKSTSKVNTLSSTQKSTRKDKIAKPSNMAAKNVVMPGFSSSKLVSEYQTKVYDLLLQIPEGKITSYAAMAKALNSSPRAVGGALRNNPFAPEVPCHRCIASTGVSGPLSSMDVRCGN